jgi:hypothetical protein
MAEKLAGVVQTCEVLLPTEGIGPSGLSLRPAEEWDADMVIGSSVRLVLPSGETHRTKLRGGEMWRLLPEGMPVAILVEFLPEIDNEVPAVTLVFVDEAA